MWGGGGGPGAFKTQELWGKLSGGDQTQTRAAWLKVSSVSQQVYFVHSLAIQQYTEDPCASAGHLCTIKLEQDLFTISLSDHP